jgi:radical SAM superfamily enzyme YgiQ (UPF0313 family)
MKILLVQPPATLSERWGKFEKIGSIQPPLGLCYIAAVLEENEKDVEILDAAAQNMNINQFRNEVRRRDPDVVGITAMTPTILYARRAIEVIKDINSDIKVLLGGTHISALPMQTLTEIPQIDFGVVGEGEYTMLELCNYFEGQRNLNDIKGIVFRKNGKIKFTGNRSPIEDLDALPFPARHKLRDLRLYRGAIGNYKRLPMTSMMSGRGCPFGCIYCDKSVFGRRVRIRSPDNIVNEIEQVITQFGIKEIIFFDDVFTINKKTVTSICDEIIKRKLDITWNCESRVDTVNLEILKKMKRAGCWQISYGVESGTQRMLDIIKKGTTLEGIRNTVKITKQVGMKARAYFMLGLPGETVESMNATIKFSQELDLDNALFSLAIPFPQTQLYEMAKKEGKMENVDWSQFRCMSTENPVYIPNGFTGRQLENGIKRAYRGFYLRPKFILQRLASIRSLNDLKMYKNAFMTIKNI